MRLFIVGNGFDKDHGLPTGYDSFRKYLLDNYGRCDYLPDPCITQLPDGGEASDLKTDANIFFRLIEDIESNSKWGQFESDLGWINYNELVDLSWNDDDDEIYHQIYNNEDKARDYSKSFDNFTVLFTNWINSIEYNKSICKEKYSDLFSNNDLYLTFNYTTILEDVYNIEEKNICHIHGKVGETLIFGHSNENDACDESIMYGDSDIIFNTMHKKLFKDTNECIRENYNFLDSISKVDEIYFLGWSMSEVDNTYIELLINKLKNKNVLIHFTKYDYEKDNINDYLKKLNGLDFTLGDNV